MMLKQLKKGDLLGSSDILAFCLIPSPTIAFLSCLIFWSGCPINPFLILYILKRKVMDHSGMFCLLCMQGVRESVVFISELKEY